MMTEPQPEYVWAPQPEKSRRGRVWLIVGLAAAALVIAAAVFWLFVRPALPGVSPTSTPSASPSLSASPSMTPSSTPSASPTFTTSPTPTTEPSGEPAPPAPEDPSIATFRDKVNPVLSDAQRGLQIARESDPQEAAQTIGLLQEDAGRLSDTVAPTSISARWSSALKDYSNALNSLRSAYETGSSASTEASNASSALTALTAVIR